MTTTYEAGARAMREVAAAVADEAGQHWLAARIRATSLPPSDEPAPGRRVVLRGEDVVGEVYAADQERVAIRFDDGRVRWLTPQMWRDDVREGRMEVGL